LVEDQEEAVGVVGEAVMYQKNSAWVELAGVGVQVKL
jgi:hypothetical protein